MSPSMIGPYVFVFGGLALGLLVGGVLIGSDPAFIGFLFGGGSGLTGGAWLAAITSNEQLLGGGQKRRAALPPHMRSGSLTDDAPITDHETDAVARLRGARAADDSDPDLEHEN